MASSENTCRGIPFRESWFSDEFDQSRSPKRAQFRSAGCGFGQCLSLKLVLESIFVHESPLTFGHTDDDCRSTTEWHLIPQARPRIGRGSPDFSPQPSLISHYAMTWWPFVTFDTAGEVRRFLEAPGQTGPPVVSHAAFPPATPRAARCSTPSP